MRKLKDVILGAVLVASYVAVLTTGKIATIAAIVAVATFAGILLAESVA